MLKQDSNAQTVFDTSILAYTVKTAFLGGLNCETTEVQKPEKHQKEQYKEEAQPRILKTNTKSPNPREQA